MASEGVANMLRHLVPLMIESKQGIIVNMSFGWGRSAATQVAPYCAPKWAVECLTRSAAKELHSGMAIVALNPDVINMDMLVSCFGSLADLYQTPESWYLSLFFFSYVLRYNTSSTSSRKMSYFNSGLKNSFRSTASIKDSGHRLLESYHTDKFHKI
ncbi:NADPH-dependent pterin aldehyde reductase [Camellia lanceoleosa]|uniref:NADPH-dependent pterin aldehyde reductase n=1 Tax=Camellia lanceoleosa TaxID=1840588 RepID=A0ACC0IK42_9ERIC|nr:NADPH-dependent pterin aldehyde reductase [Camellia lanceoleosa]